MLKAHYVVNTVSSASSSMIPVLKRRQTCLMKKSPSSAPPTTCCSSRRGRRVAVVVKRRCSSRRGRAAVAADALKHSPKTRGCDCFFSMDPFFFYENRHTSSVFAAVEFSPPGCATDEGNIVKPPTLSTSDLPDPGLSQWCRCGPASH
jgi:hypothetical protein